MSKPSSTHLLDAQTRSMTALDLHEVFAPKTRHAYFGNIQQVRLPNGLCMEYALHGEDDASDKVLLIMGMHAAKEAWLPILSTMLHPSSSGTNASIQLVTFDNRGVGNSDKPWGWYSTSQMAQDALLLLDHLQWSKAHVVGSSLGGMIAQELALAAPGRVLSLALLVTTPGFRQGPMPGRAQTTAYLSLLQSMVFPTHDRIATTSLGTLFPHDYLQQKQGNGTSAYDILYKYHLTKLETSKTTLAGELGHYVAVLGHNVTEDRLTGLANSGLPIVVIGATQDRLLHPDHSTVLCKCLGDETEFFVLDDAGHDVHIQHRLEVSEALVKVFIRGRHSSNEVQSTPLLARVVLPSNGWSGAGASKSKTRKRH
ncbi:Aste57867_20851 [Aphanomyces stellatus]|uniref:Aste57867_20851 protein n=1 Tax=Aphanomyces stellatus TaxID=120398 RepID=A0A485LH86_9STRA|nr:hypothetical protein As57867_020783 [Aphanomyces stellatus]VFT97529.1 Aste57867_20851 [Aphanomyces stellatus]